VDLSPSACLERMRKLREAGAFRGFHADVDEHLLGIRLQALISVRLTQHLRNLVDSFWDPVVTLPEVIAVYHVAGAHDFMVHVAVRDADHLRDLAMDAFTTRPEVANLETRLVFQFRRSPHLPVYLAEDGPPTGRIR